MIGLDCMSYLILNTLIIRLSSLDFVKLFKISICTEDLLKLGSRFARLPI